MPQNSFVMLLCKAEQFVGESTESLLRHTDDDFELIIIDDTPTDASPDIARR